MEFSKEVFNKLDTLIEEASRGVDTLKHLGMAAGGGLVGGALGLAAPDDMQGLATGVGAALGTGAGMAAGAKMIKGNRQDQAEYERALAIDIAKAKAQGTMNPVARAVYN